MRIAILDDQETDLEVIEEITQKAFLESGMPCEIWKYTSPEELLFEIEEDNKFDIYLLDIEIPGTSGLQVAQAIKGKFYNPVIIYVTNHVEYAVAGYETNAYRYIPKSMLEKKLPEAYRSVLSVLENREKEYYIIEKNHKIEKIAYEDIYCVKKEVKNVLIIHKHGTSRERRTLSDFHETLKKDGQFIMVDRSWIVNIRHIISLKDQQIHLRNGEIIPVSRPKLSFVKKEILRVWKQSM